MHKRFKLRVIIALFLPSFLSFSSAQAEENLWTYTKAVDTRPQGSFELKLSDIWRIGKNSGQYSFHDIRPEVEYGITDKLTVGAEIIIMAHDYSVDDPNLNPMYETQETKGGKFDETQYAGYELALKYNILSPYKDIVGLSFGLGFENRDKYRLDGSDIDQQSYTISIYLQKNWIDDKLTLVVNGKTEFERRRSTGILEEEIAFDISAAVAYRMLPKHFVGLEYRRQEDHLSPYNTETDSYNDPQLSPSEFDLTNWKIGTRHQYGDYIGASYHYAQKNWWLTMGILFQVKGGGSRHAYNKNGKNFDEHEKIHIGLSYGYEF